MKKGADQKQVILSTARRKFLTYGFHHVSIDSIVRDLHTSKSTIYKYYSTKEDLIKGVLDQLNHETNDQLEIIINDEDTSFPLKLGLVIEFTRNTLARINEEFLQDLKFRTPEIWNYYEESRKFRIEKYYRQLFIHGIEQGIVRKDIDIQILLEIYLHLTDMSVNADQFNKVHYSNQDLYSDISKVFLEGALIRENES
jgi:AcrR family transcriptional regulator